MSETTTCRNKLLMMCLTLGWVGPSCRSIDKKVDSKTAYVRDSSNLLEYRGTDGLFRFGEKIDLPKGKNTHRYALVFNSDAKFEITSSQPAKMKIYGPKKIGKEFVRLIKKSRDKLVIDSIRQGRYQLVVETDTAFSGGILSNDCLVERCGIKTWNLADKKDEITLVAVGDIGLQAHRATNDRIGGKKYSEYHLYSEMFEGFDYYLDGDINLGNMEIAITDFETPRDKKYVFRMPVEGLESAVRAGFNVFSIANNHIGDYGTLGVTDTIANLRAVSNNLAKISTASKMLRKSGYPVLGWSGAGVNQEEAEQVKIFTVKNTRVAFASIGIGLYAGLMKPGIASIKSLGVIEQLGRSRAKLKILSVHGGVEYEKNPQDNIQVIAKRASEAGIDFVHVHHPHIVLPIVKIGKTVIAYSMGNFMLRGARNLAQYEKNMDYGLALKLHYNTRRRRITSIEAISLKDTHRIVLPNRRKDGAVRINSLNDEAQKLEPGNAILFKVTSSGHGIKRF